MGFRWLQDPVAIVGIQVQNIGPRLPPPSPPQHPSHQHLIVPKHSGLPMPKVLATLEKTFALPALSTLKQTLCQSPTGSPASGLPLFLRFYPTRDVPVLVTDTVQAGGSDGTISVSPT